MQIGDKVWIFDSDHRVYIDDKGNKTVGTWYRGYFVEKYIIGETKQSWIVGDKDSRLEYKCNIKVSKKTLNYTKYGGDKKLYISEEEIDQECWMVENKSKIRDLVNYCKDYNKLKKIEEILNS